MAHISEETLKMAAKFFPFVVVRNSHKDGTQLVIDSVVVAGFEGSERAMVFAEMEYNKSNELKINNTYDIYHRKGNTITKYYRMG